MPSGVCLIPSLTHNMKYSGNNLPMFRMSVLNPSSEIEAGLAFGTSAGLQGVNSQ
jgi:hypothetical protein